MTSISEQGDLRQVLADSPQRLSKNPSVSLQLRRSFKETCNTALNVLSGKQSLFLII